MQRRGEPHPAKPSISWSHGPGDPPNGATSPARGRAAAHASPLPPDRSAGDRPRAPSPQTPYSPWTGRRSAITRAWGPVDWRDTSICLLSCLFRRLRPSSPGRRRDDPVETRPNSLLVLGLFIPGGLVDEVTWPFDLTRLASGRDGAIASCQMASRCIDTHYRDRLDIAGVS